MRLGALTVAIGILALLHCGKDPTELEVEIFATDCATVTSTSVRVGQPGSVSASTPAAAKKTGCTEGRIGSIVLYPSGAEDAQVEVDVVTGFGKDAEQCSAALDGCIQARRIAHFTPETSTHIGVVMDPRCLGKVCPASQTCEAGNCIGAEGVGTGPDAGQPDASVDAPPADPCAACTAAGGTCSGGSCTFNCSSASKCASVVCPPGLPCDVTCNGAGSCGDVSCSGPGCHINCMGTMAGPGCGNVTCTGSGECNITCGWCSGNVKCTAEKCTLLCYYVCNNVDLSPTGTGSTARCGGFVDCDFKCDGEQCDVCKDGQYSCEPKQSQKCTKTGGC